MSLHTQRQDLHISLFEKCLGGRCCYNGLGRNRIFSSGTSPRQTILDMNGLGADDCAGNERRKRHQLGCPGANRRKDLGGLCFAARSEPVGHFGRGEGHGCISTWVMFRPE